MSNTLTKDRVFVINGTVYTIKNAVELGKKDRRTGELGKYWHWYFQKAGENAWTALPKALLLKDIEAKLTEIEARFAAARARKAAKMADMQEAA